jgi:hypothetical protein
MTHAITHINRHTVTVTGQDAQRVAEALAAIADVRRSLESAVVFDPEDWGATNRLAWIYGICVGWGEALPEVVARHNWSPETVARLQRLHEAFTTLKF